jgi:hypothetical protein
MIVCDTHFYHGRTSPCERQQNDEGGTIDDSMCGPCREKIGYRTHAYVAAFDVKRNEHFLFECTTHAAKAFAEYREATGTLRGCAFQASRPKCTPNGKVAIITNTVNLAKCKLPKEPNLILALSVIWRLPIQGLQLEHQNHRPDKVTTEAGPLHEMREQPDNAADPEQTERRRAELLAAFNAPPKPNGKAKPTKAPA